MIFDLVSNLRKYESACPGLDRAVAFLTSTDLSALPVGRHELDGDNCYVMVIDYATKPPAECFLEAHRQYADVQTLACGEELIGVAPEGSGAVTQEYDPDQDVYLLEGDYRCLRIEPGVAAVFLPDEPHAPAMAVDQPAPARKVVVKLKIRREG